ncbi:MAG: GNAT family N-acetyltransferase [Spirulinaceae cyanobacterium]
MLWLDDLYVDEQMRNKGAGLVLMNHLAQVFRANNCSHLAWTADARNTRGLNFYSRLGAEVIKQEVNSCLLIWKPDQV